MAEPTPWRQTSGNDMSGDSVDCASSGGPPPPPPPPLALGAVPAVRLKSEISERRPEPPACVQNAMMTKDKKPFTYTPGGLDLSQIRSPRMARRITRNANAEGVGAVPTNQPQQHVPLPPSALAAMQPQLPVQVFPTGGGMPSSIPPPPPPPILGNGVPPPPPPMMVSQAPIAKAPSPPTNNSNSQTSYQRPDIKIPENPMGMLRRTGGPHRTQEPPPVVQSPVMPVQQPNYQPQYQPVQSQPQYQPVQSQPQYHQPIYQPVQSPVSQPVYQQPPQPSSPEHKAENRTQVGSLYIPPLNADELQRTPSQKSESPGSPMDTLKKAPTPWLTGRAKQQQEPTWARADSIASSTASTPSTPITPATPKTPASPAPVVGGARVIPVQIDMGNTMNTMNKKQQQFMQQQQQQFMQQQQQFLQQQQQQFMQQQQQQFRQQQQQQQFRQQQHVVRVIPIQVEGARPGPMSPNSNVGTPDISGAPVQSPTFRILERVTSRDEEIHSQPAIDHPATQGHSFPVDQLRKMQLNDEDKSLMNRVRNQVDEDCFLHDEVDPRYRGPAIPSRAFRMLQNMTNAAEASGDPTCAPRAVVVNRGPQQQGVINRNSPQTTGVGESTLPPSEQTVPEPRKYTGSAIPSRSFQMLQAMVAPENCANGPETDENITNYPYVDPNLYPWGYDQMYPPPYCYDPYWAYYQQDPNAYAPETANTPTVDSAVKREQNQTPTEEEYYPQMPPYWDPYYAYYAAYYGGYYPPPMPHPYSPHAFYPSNETDDYSSNDEMSYYGARFQGPTPCGHKSMPSDDQATPTDTEVEEIVENELKKSDSHKSGLQAKRSVSDIQMYNEENGETPDQLTTDGEEDTDSSDTEDDGDIDSDENENAVDEEGHLPHQLSVIFEESEMSDIERKRRETSIATTVSEDDSSTTIGGGKNDTDDSCDDEQDLEEATVTVRLPLKLKFGRSENGKEEVTELIVGDSSMQHNSPEDTSVSITLSLNKTPTPLCRQNSEETVENYETATENDTRDNSPVQYNQDDESDFWGEINKPVSNNEDDNELSDDEAVSEKEVISTKANKEQLQIEDEEDDEDESSDSDDDNSDQEADDCKLEKDLRDAFASDSVKERVRALREAGKLHIGAESKEEVVSVRQRIMAIENGEGTGTASRSSSAKGCDLSEEDGDSGVTSDSDFSERLLKRYQRAATHSRLFKLLQDECAKSDDEDDDDDDEEEGDGNLEFRRNKLTLPLNSSEPESFASSGFCSPASPTWLARELVHGLLGGSQGRKYKALPLEKLYAAAQRILQEDALSNTSEDGSPLESYASDYRSYYSSWEDASLKRRIGRCPRVKSEKNIAGGGVMKVAEVDENDSCPTRSRSCSRSPCRQQTTSAS